MRVVVVGAGIIGLATARELLDADAKADVVVLEKEHDVARHQTSHNSGVVHAGLYYKPGSLKARLCRRGAGLLREYCRTHGIDYEECGKLIVATHERDLRRLADIEDRAQANGVPAVRRLEASDLKVVEPHVRGIAGLHSPTTAIVDFAEVAHALHRELVERGAQVRLGATVAAVRDELVAAEVTLSDGSVIVADRVVVCAGLHADRLARASGRSADPCIIPFRGEYYALRPERETLVRGLIYPVPDPSLPFLGVHLTKRIDGRVLVGPNAILALAREGYNRFSFDAADVRDIVLSNGMRRIARRYWRTAATEIGRASSRRLFIQAARQYVPELLARDLVPARAGVRAQAVSAAGELVDDFVLDHSRHVVWVRNAPSPAATSSFAIAEELLGRL